MDNRIKLLKADITMLDVDAIVNAANASLLGGGGVDGAIHKAAGPQLLQACKKLNGCNTGDAKITPGFNLKAKYVIHTVGPVWHGGNNSEAELLASCYRRCFELAEQHQLKSIAFPNISTGVYRFPKARACVIAVNVAQQKLAANKQIEQVYFVCFDDENFQLYHQLLLS